MKRLSLLRKKHDMSQSELAEKLGVTQQTISKYENGSREPDTETLKLLSSIFDVSIDYLLGNTNIKNTTDSADKIAESINDDPELAQFWDSLKDREDLKLLFKQTRDMSPNDIKKIIRIIKAIEDEEDRNDG
ncbi:helix-turn-helix domain-containing protein [Clostridium sp. BJN0013]|uniref:helix-turn-helix domain-containing protein n=1 Tax=Clostridium sp. BJN0013 TaxID=3236840 RepID=UPI0034C6886D